MPEFDLTHAYPPQWSVGKALDTYLAENGFDKESYDAPWVKISFRFLTIPFPNPPSRRTAVRLHDLHHVATGYGTDLTGEAEISAWELRYGLKGLRLFVRGIVFSGALFGLLHCPRRTGRAWQAGAGSTNLFARNVAKEYPALLELTVAELRQQLGIPRDGLNQVRGLHSAAPLPA